MFAWQALSFMQTPNALLVMDCPIRRRFRNSGNVRSYISDRIHIWEVTIPASSALLCNDQKFELDKFTKLFSLFSELLLASRQ
jgi:hypothetical protein